MGKVNDQLNFYLNDSIRLADFFNGVLYGGEQIISPLQLADVQKCYQEPLCDRYGPKRAARRERDVAKLLFREGHPVLLAVENQDQINYCMPLRCAEYDLTDLKRQLRRIKQHHKEAKDLKGGAELFSGMKLTDQLIPSVTIVFYHGKGTWTAAKQLYQLLNLKGTDDILRGLLENYRLHLVSLHDLDENKFKTDLRQVIGIAKRRDDKDALSGYCAQNADRLCNLNEDTYDLICALLNRRTLLQRKEQYFNREKEDYNMCKAMDDWEKESIAKGKKLGQEAGEKIGELRGLKMGEKAGEQRLSALIKKLSQDNRLDDIIKAANNVQTRRRLYREYSL